MALELSKGTVLAYHLGRLKDGKGARARTGERREAEQHEGGIEVEYPIMRHMTNLVITSEGAEGHTLVIGEQLTDPQGLHVIAHI